MPNVVHLGDEDSAPDAHDDAVGSVTVAARNAGVTTFLAPTSPPRPPAGAGATSFATVVLAGMDEEAPPASVPCRTRSPTSTSSPSDPASSPSSSSPNDLRMIRRNDDAVTTTPMLLPSRAAREVSGFEGAHEARRPRPSRGVANHNQDHSLNLHNFYPRNGNLNDNGASEQAVVEEWSPSLRGSGESVSEMSMMRSSAGDNEEDALNMADWVVIAEQAGHLDQDQQRQRQEGAEELFFGPPGSGSGNITFFTTIPLARLVQLQIGNETNEWRDDPSPTNANGGERGRGAGGRLRMRRFDFDLDRERVDVVVFMSVCIVVCAILGAFMGLQAATKILERRMQNRSRKTRGDRHRRRSSKHDK